MAESLPESVAGILHAIAECERVEGQRLVVAIAGPPAAGKTTLAERLRAELSPHAAVLGLDAFHFDDQILHERGDRDRKGAPHTFDVVGYSHLLRLLRAQGDVEVAVPVFDRSLELTRNCAEVVHADHSVIITEGNYLLLDSAPWSGLDDLFDLTIWVHAELDEIEARILQRWAALDPAQARWRAEQNDLPNARHVVANSRPATLSFSSAS